MADQTKTQQALDRLKDAIEEFTNTDTYLSFLRHQAKFHKYSWRNSLLIQKQKPDATYVKGFKGWLEVGRAVRKGERAIIILAPRRYTRTVEVDGQDKEYSGMTFAATPVFDISQTDPLDGFENPFDPKQTFMPDIDDERGADLYAALERHLIDEEGVTVELYDEGRGDGWYRPNEKRIAVKSGSNLKMLNTLIHEAAHHLARSSEQQFGYGGEEVVVESVAYVVADHFGLDTSVSSVPYVASWLRSDPKGFQKGMGEIQKLSARLIDVLTVAQAAERELVAA